MCIGVCGQEDVSWKATYGVFFVFFFVFFFLVCYDDRQSEVDQGECKEKVGGSGVHLGGCRRERAAPSVDRRKWMDRSR